MTLILTASCETEPGQPLAPTPAAVDGGQTLAECDPGPLPGELTTSAGGRLRFSFLPPAGTNVTYAVDVPTGWRLDVRQNDVTLRVPNEARGDHFLSIYADCEDATEMRRVAVHIDPISWSSVTTWNPEADEGPSFRQLAQFVSDPEQPERLFLYGGFEPPFAFARELWAYVYERDLWTLVLSAGEMPELGGGMVAPIPGADAMLVLGGIDEADFSTPFLLGRLDYGPEQQGWTPLDVVSPPRAGAYAGAFVHDSPRDRHISACGISDGTIHCDVAAYDGEQNVWAPLEVVAEGGQGPSGRYGFAHAYDVETQRLIIFSGGGEATASDPVNPAQDTWALELSEDPPRWVRLAGPSPETPGRRNSCYGLDEDGHRLIVWGGTPNAERVYDDVLVLDLDRGFEQWSRITDIANAPPARSSCSGAYDPVRQRILFGFGNTRQAIFTDLWALNL